MTPSTWRDCGSSIRPWPKPLNGPPPPAKPPPPPPTKPIFPSPPKNANYQPFVPAPIVDKFGQLLYIQRVMIKVSTKSTYAIRALVHLGREPQGTSVSLPAI